MRKEELENEREVSSSGSEEQKEDDGAAEADVGEGKQPKQFEETKRAGKKGNPALDKFYGRKKRVSQRERRGVYHD